LLLLEEQPATIKITATVKKRDACLTRPNTSYVKFHESPCLMSYYERNYGVTCDRWPAARIA